MRHEFGGLIFGEAYTWRGLFLEFYGIMSFKIELKMQELAANGHFGFHRITKKGQKFQDYELRILIIHKFTSILIFLAGGT